MTVNEMISKFEKLTPAKISELAVKSVLQNSDVVISDAIVANAEGKTFAGNEIKKYTPFTDWEQTGEFHENLRFENNNDIAFTSNGDGAKAIFETFPEVDTIAPTAKILDGSTIADIQNDLVINIKNEIGI